MGPEGGAQSLAGLGAHLDEQQCNRRRLKRMGRDPEPDDKVQSRARPGFVCQTLASKGAGCSDVRPDASSAKLCALLSVEFGPKSDPLVHAQLNLTRAGPPGRITAYPSAFARLRLGRKGHVHCMPAGSGLEETELPRRMARKRAPQRARRQPLPVTGKGPAQQRARAQHMPAVRTSTAPLGGPGAGPGRGCGAGDALSAAARPDQEALGAARRPATHVLLRARLRAAPKAVACLLAVPWRADPAVVAAIAPWEFLWRAVVAAPDDMCAALRARPRRRGPPAAAADAGLAHRRAPRDRRGGLGPIPRLATRRGSGRGRQGAGRHAAGTAAGRPADEAAPDPHIASIGIRGCTRIWRPGRQQAEVALTQRGPNVSGSSPGEANWGVRGLLARHRGWRCGRLSDRPEALGYACCGMPGCTRGQPWRMM